MDGLETTLGRLIFNEALDGLIPFVNETIKGKKLKSIIETILDVHGIEAAQKILDRVKLLGFEMVTVSGITFAMADLIIPTEKKQIVAEADRSSACPSKSNSWKYYLPHRSGASARSASGKGAKEQITKKIATVLPKENPVFQITNSGARGSVEAALAGHGYERPRRRTRGARPSSSRSSPRSRKDCLYLNTSFQRTALVRAD